MNTPPDRRIPVAAGPQADVDPASVRSSYLAAELDESQLAPTWHEQLQGWYAQAAADPRVVEANAIQVATVDADGAPDVRTVLLRALDADGVVFYTNYDSAKGAQLSHEPRVAVLFSWLPLERQVRLRGTAHKVGREVTEAYFATRPRGSQLGAWASPQSTVIDSRSVLQVDLDGATARFGDGPIPAPPNWGGYRVAVDTAEFWQGREYRLHDRLRYRRNQSGWTVERLAP